MPLPCLLEQHPPSVRSASCTGPKAPDTSISLLAVHGVDVAYRQCAGDAVDADMAPYPGYGPTLPGGDHNLSPIRAESAQSHAPAMQVRGHRGPVDAEPLG